MIEYDMVILVSTIISHSFIRFQVDSHNVNEFLKSFMSYDLRRQPVLQHFKWCKKEPVVIDKCDNVINGNNFVLFN